MKAFRYRNLPNYISGPCYVYAYIDPRSNEFFYIGKGKNNRWKYHLKAVQRADPKAYERNRLKYNKIAKLLRENTPPEVQFVATCLSDQDALNLEMGIVNQLGTIFDGTGPLTNIVRNAWHRDYSDTAPFKKIGEKQRANWRNPCSTFNSEAYREKVAESRKGEGNPRYGDHRSYMELHGEERARDLKTQMSKRRQGAGNSRSKQWLVTSPTGQQFEVFGELKKFCEEHNLSLCLLRQQIGNPVVVKFRSKRTKHETSGWLLQEIPNPRQQHS